MTVTVTERNSVSIEADMRQIGGQLLRSSFRKQFKFLKSKKSRV